ncbi:MULTISPECIES: hypothetical protein [unclassified Methanoregula]|uniref:hypothetical protein n=1 Tax=unclassified Methanoregula TaxID=2649730 RepID=UPI002600FEB6|nr:MULTISPECIES: hypothetical protein [unclassified Methanoregula]
MSAIIKKLNITTFRYLYLVVFAIPVNYFIISGHSGIIIQWVFFRYQLTATSESVIPITTSLSRGFLYVSHEAAIFESLIFLGCLCFVISWILLFYRTSEPVKKAGLFTIAGAILTTSAYIMFLGSGGTSIPVGMPFILVIGSLMYWHTPDSPDISTGKKTETESENPPTGSIPAEGAPVAPEPPGSAGIRPEYYFPLVFLNLVTNFIFLPSYGFVSDDWSQCFHAFRGISLPELIFESHRPGFYIILKGLSMIFGTEPIWFFLFNFIVSSILLLMVFITARLLLAKIHLFSESYAFLVAVLFCILFNKGELYAFGSVIPDNIAFALYLVSLYFYIQSDKKPFFIFLSLFSFTVALFTYEVGIILPFFYCIYSLCTEKTIRKPLAFFIPLVVYCVVRLTNWGGYGIVVNPGNDITLVNFIPSVTANIVYLKFNLAIFMNTFPEYFMDSITGLERLPSLPVTALLIIDIVVAALIVWILTRYSREDPETPEFDGTPLILVGLAGIILSFLLISLNGFIAGRYLVFIDFFVCLLGVLILIKCAGKRSIAYGLFFIIVFCLLINQGLYFNWVVSGNIQQSFHEAVQKNSEKISQYEFVYVNITDLGVVKGNYLNARGLHSWSIIAMMQDAGIDTSDTTLIYNVEDENEKPVETIENRSYFEFNRSNVDLTRMYYAGVSRSVA